MNKDEYASLQEAGVAPLVRLRNKVLAEIGQERDRQVGAEGWSEKHDDSHVSGEMARAAACYAYAAGLGETHRDIITLHAQRGERSGIVVIDRAWPWELRWWKPKDRRRDLIRAAALVVAEIERLDRQRRFDS